MSAENLNYCFVSNTRSISVHLAWDILYKCIHTYVALCLLQIIKTKHDQTEEMHQSVRESFNGFKACLIFQISMNANTITAIVRRILRAGTFGDRRNAYAARDIKCQETCANVSRLSMSFL